MRWWVDTTGPLHEKPEVPSCHACTVNGYAIEGHVPAEDVRRLRAENPDAIGLSGPGMPVGSPGTALGDQQRDPYQVLLRPTPESAPCGAPCRAIHP